MGDIRGDRGSDIVSQQGTTSQWLTVHVREVDSDPFPVAMSMTARLASPPDANFDLFLYGESSACGVPDAQSTNHFNVDEVSVWWGEDGLFSNGSDDSQTITIEVRWVSGTCKSDAPWTLTVEGNT